MGFQRGNLKLEFDDPEFAGLEVKSRRFSVGELLDVHEFGVLLRQGTKEERKERLDDLFRLLDEKIVSWNYEDEDGLPVEKTAGSLAGIDEAFLEAILTGVVQGSKRVAVPLERPSADGPPALEVSLPMEPLTPNPPS